MMWLTSSRALSKFVRLARFQQGVRPLLCGATAIGSSTSHHGKKEWQNKNGAMVAALLGSAAAMLVCEEKPTGLEEEDDSTTHVLNWSGTHSVNVKNEHYYEPETVEELEAIVASCYEKGLAVRPVGSALSPNAISFQKEGMVSLANLDKIVKVDKENMTVTVQAGARVSQVVEALREHGLTLPNLASIAEQQMGGFVQVGAHGTGAAIAPVDHYVTSLKLVTPSPHGTILLTEKDDGDSFQLAKVAMGTFGIVTELTMKCIPAHNLVEHTYVLSRAEAKANIKSLLKQHKHVRYMWFPYEDAVTVVTNDPEDDINNNTTTDTSSLSMEEKLFPFTNGLKQFSKCTPKPYTDEMLTGMDFGQLRDAFLALAPLDYQLVREVNKAEAQFWRNSEGYQTKPSDQLLQFNCGGQQWVFEVCFPTGTYDNNDGNDMKFMEELLDNIESNKIPASGPIEQRWSASSSSPMSPSHGPDGGLHCWVGIIMYLVSDDKKERMQITEKFKGQYCDIVRKIGMKYGIMSHWAKLEQPNNSFDLLMLRALMKAKLPLNKFNDVRSIYDPKNLLSNDLINSVLGFSNKTQNIKSE